MLQIIRIIVIIFLAVFKRTFCDDDIALISCPDDKQLVFHKAPFYGQMNSSESCPASNGKTCTSDIRYGDVDDFCSSSSCTISPVSYQQLDQRECKDSDNYLTLYHSCQKSKYYIDICRISSIIKTLRVFNISNFMFSLLIFNKKDSVENKNAKNQCHHLYCIDLYWLTCPRLLFMYYFCLFLP